MIAWQLQAGMRRTKDDDQANERKSLSSRALQRSHLLAMPKARATSGALRWFIFARLIVSRERRSARPTCSWVTNEGAAGVLRNGHAP